MPILTFDEPVTFILADDKDLLLTPLVVLAKALVLLFLALLCVPEALLLRTEEVDVFPILNLKMHLNRYFPRREQKWLFYFTQQRKLVKKLLSY